MSKQHLQDMLEAIIAGKQDEAKAAFHTYITDKVRGLVTEAKKDDGSKESKEDKGSKEDKKAPPFVKKSKEDSAESKEDKGSKEDGKKKKAPPFVKKSKESKED